MFFQTVWVLDLPFREVNAQTLMTGLKAWSLRSGMNLELLWTWSNLYFFSSFTSGVTIFGTFYCATVQDAAMLNIMTKAFEDAQHFQEHMHISHGIVHHILSGSKFCSWVDDDVQKLLGRIIVSLLRCWLNIQSATPEVLEVIPANIFPDFQMCLNFTSVDHLCFMMGTKINIYQNNFNTATLNIICFF